MVVNCLVYIRIVVFMHMFSISLDILFAKINGSRVDKHTLKDYLYEFDPQNNFIYHEYDICSRPPDPYYIALTRHMGDEKGSYVG
jgi:hypothetical protein